MRCDCEIVVDRAELGAAVMSGAIRAPDLRTPLWIALRPAAGGLRIETASLDAEIEGRGAWKRWVKVDADLFRGVVGRLGNAPTVALVYAAGRLSINRTMIPAYGEPSPLERRPEGWQGVFSGMAPVSARELAERAWQSPSRPRRGQQDARGLPLFKACLRP